MGGAARGAGVAAREGMARDISMTPPVRIGIAAATVPTGAGRAATAAGAGARPGASGAGVLTGACT